MTRHRAHRLTALVTALALTGSACALIPAEEQRSQEEVMRRLELLDGHVKATRDAAVFRRHLTGGITMGVGAAFLGAGFYLRTVEDAQTPDAEETDKDTSANGILLAAGLMGVVGLVIFFFPTLAESQSETYLEAREDGSKTPDALLTLGEGVLRRVAWEDFQERMEWGLPLFALGVGTILLTTTLAEEDTPSDVFATAVGLGSVAAVGGGVVVFTPTTAETRWSEYKEQVKGMQRELPAEGGGEEEEAPTSWFVVPALTADGAGFAAGARF